VDEAVQQRNTFIEHGLESAQSSWAGGYHDFALSEFGDAIHPIMDLTSPEHTASNGDPITWCWPIGCSGNRGHSPNDWIGKERTQDITPQNYRDEDQAIRDAYSFMTGQSMACRKEP